MAKKFNKNDVLRFLYEEMDPAEQDQFLEALVTDEELWNTFEELKEAKEEIKPELVEPSEFSVNKVLKYARDSHFEVDGPQPFGVSGQSRKPAFTVPVLLSVVMVLCATVTIALGVYGFRNASAQSALNEDAPQLQWESPMLQNRMDMVRMNLQNLSGPRETVLPVYNNTYRLVNTTQFSPSVENVVLLNLR